MFWCWKFSKYLRMSRQEKMKSILKFPRPCGRFPCCESQARKWNVSNACRTVFHMFRAIDILIVSRSNDRSKFTIDAIQMLACDFLVCTWIVKLNFAAEVRRGSAACFSDSTVSICIYIINIHRMSSLWTLIENRAVIFTISFFGRCSSCSYS